MMQVLVFVCLLVDTGSVDIPIVHYTGRIKPIKTLFFFGPVLRHFSHDFCLGRLHDLTFVITCKRCPDGSRRLQYSTCTCVV